MLTWVKINLKLKYKSESLDDLFWFIRYYRKK